MILKRKKAQGIPMETVIIAILVLVVLVVIIAFFVGGTGSLTQKMKQIFTGKTAGTERPLAVDFCKQYCDQLSQETDMTPEAAKGTLYCKKYFYLDSEGRGDSDRGTAGNYQKDKPYVKFYCYPGAESSSSSDTEPKGSLGVGCGVSCT